MRELTVFEEINVDKQILRDRDDPIKFMSEVEFYQKFRFLKHSLYTE
jgi:hypothetical protein